MTASLGLLLVLGAFGGFDTVYYHIYTCRLYAHPSCRWENLTHAGHSLFFTLFIVLLQIRATGDWYWVYPAVCFGQTLNQLADVMLESGSRASIGGVPSGEYRLHGIIGPLWGAMMVAVLFEAEEFRAAPTGLAWRDIGLPCSVLLWGGVPIGAAFFAFDLVGGLRASLPTARYAA